MMQDMEMMKEDNWTVNARERVPCPAWNLYKVFS